MDRLYAPWRQQYVMAHLKQKQVQECVFCTVFDGKESDADRYILYKNNETAVLLNLYPYNSGHLLIISKYHVENLYDLPENITQQIMKACMISTKIIQEQLMCEGMNVGLNIGRVAGAGIPDHVHMHIVPRFLGDTGFLTTIGDSKQISINLDTMYQKLRPYFENIKL